MSVCGLRPQPKVPPRHPVSICRVCSLNWYNKIYKLIPDPTQPGGSITKTLPARALANIKLDVEADLAWDNLLKAGEPEIKTWAERKNTLPLHQL